MEYKKLSSGMNFTSEFLAGKTFSAKEDINNERGS
jgi:hypothetical protein